jgi:hypothetical protein
MNDNDGLLMQISEPGQWVSYEWVVATTDDLSGSCCEEMGTLSLKNVGATADDHFCSEMEFVHEGSIATERLIFKMLIDSKSLQGNRESGWFQVNDEPVKPLNEFRPNRYADLVYLYQQVFGRELFSLRGEIDQRQSLGMKTISYSRGQFDCTGTTTITSHDAAFGSEKTLRVRTSRTIWRNQSIPFVALAESHVAVRQRLLGSENVEDSGWTSALHLFDTGWSAESRLNV